MVRRDLIEADVEKTAEKRAGLGTVHATLRVHDSAENSLDLCSVRAWVQDGVVASRLGVGVLDPSLMLLGELSGNVDELVDDLVEFGPVSRQGLVEVGNKLLFFRERVRITCSRPFLGMSKNAPRRREAGAGHLR